MNSYLLSELFFAFDDNKIFQIIETFNTISYKDIFTNKIYAADDLTNIVPLKRVIDTNFLTNLIIDIDGNELVKIDLSRLKSILTAIKNNKVKFLYVKYQFLINKVVDIVMKMLGLDVNNLEVAVTAKQIENIKKYLFRILFSSLIINGKVNIDSSDDFKIKFALKKSKIYQIVKEFKIYFDLNGILKVNGKSFIKENQKLLRFNQ